MSPKLSRSCPHILQAVASAPVGRGLIGRKARQTPTIIANLSNNPVVSYGQAEPDRLTAGVTGRVTNCFFENQEYVSALLRIQLDLVEFGRRLKAPCDAFCAKQVRRELPDAEHYIAHIVPPGIDGPDNVAH